MERLEQQEMDDNRKGESLGYVDHILLDGQHSMHIGEKWKGIS